MEAIQTQTLADLQEDQVLAAIVEAILDAEQELHQADEEDWTNILVTACRRQKSLGGSDRELLAIPC